jgi:hypothetical protein
MDFKGIVSLLTEKLGGGARDIVQLLRGGELGVSDTHAPYQEMTLRGEVFYLDSDSVAVVAANSTKGVMGVIRFLNGFYNPIGSSVDAVILSVNIATVSGTPAGPFFHNFFPQKTPAIALAESGTILSGYLNAAKKMGSKMLALVNVVLITNPADTATPAVQLGLVGGSAAIAAGAGIYSIFEDVRGRIVVPPGCMYGITALAVGVTHVIQSTICFAEVPRVGG